MLHNANVRALLNRTFVNGLVFVMGGVDVFCEVQTELLGVIYEVSRTPYSEAVLDHPSVGI
jgi:hypothetical protein